MTPRRDCASIRGSWAGCPARRAKDALRVEIGIEIAIEIDATAAAPPDLTDKPPIPIPISISISISIPIAASMPTNTCTVSLLGNLTPEALLPEVGNT